MNEVWTSITAAPKCLHGTIAASQVWKNKSVIIKLGLFLSISVTVSGKVFPSFVRIITKGVETNNLIVKRE